MKQQLLLRQRLLSRAQFADFMAGERGQRSGGANAPVQVLVPAPYAIVPCTCGDVNCHGWRFVAVIGERAAGIRDLTYEPVYAGA